MIVDPKGLAAILGVDVRSVANYANAGMPRAGRGEYDVTACVRWYVDRERETARLTVLKRASLTDVDLAAARLRKLTAEAQEVEIRVATMLGEVIPLEVADEVGGRIAEQLLPVLQNIPSNYGLRLEESGIPAAKAEAVLESIALELTTTLRNSLDDEDDHDSEESEAA